jgi:hypothetical protein
MRLAPNTRFDSGIVLTEKEQNGLTDQLDNIFNVLSDGLWHTVAEVAGIFGYQHTSVDAQFRNLRKEKFGGWNVARKKIGGVSHYRIEGKI